MEGWGGGGDDPEAITDETRRLADSLAASSRRDGSTERYLIAFGGDDISRVQQSRLKYRRENSDRRRTDILPLSFWGRLFDGAAGFRGVENAIGKNRSGGRGHGKALNIRRKSLKFRF